MDTADVCPADIAEPLSSEEHAEVARLIQASAEGRMIELAPPLAELNSLLESANHHWTEARRLADAAAAPGE